MKSNSIAITATAVALTLGVQVSSLAAGGSDYQHLQTRSDDAKGVAKLDSLIGSWRCQGSNLQPDGSWKDSPNLARWDWFYILSGKAIQDFWYSNANDLSAPGSGTNVRIVDRETGNWMMSWATDTAADFQTFSATTQKLDSTEGTVVMLGTKPAAGQIPAHSVRITFHKMRDTSFQWKYEAAAPSTEQFREMGRLSCKRHEAPNGSVSQ